MSKNQRERNEDAFFLASLGKKVDGRGPMATMIYLAFDGNPKMRKKAAKHLLDFDRIKVSKTKRSLEFL